MACSYLVLAFAVMIGMSQASTVTEDVNCVCSATPSSCSFIIPSSDPDTSYSCTCSGATLSCTVTSSDAGCDSTQYNINAFCTLACATGGVSFVSATYVSCSSSSSSCFPSDATVQLANGQTKTMADLQVKDRVLVDPTTYSDVFMFTHRYAGANYSFVEIKTAETTLWLTNDHYLYVNDKLATAQTVKVGDVLTTGEGKPTSVLSVGTSIRTGLYSPNTLHGDIVVNGIKASTYTASIAPTLAHYALWPVRMLYKLGYDVVGNAFDEGSELIAALMPNGKSAY